MIKAYLVGISTQYENEDIEIRYRIIKNGEDIVQKSILMDYRKPLVVTHVALLTLLKELESYTDNEDVVVVINDAALLEQIRGTSTSKNKEVLKMARIVREQLNKHTSRISFQDVSGDYEEMTKWNEALKF